MPAGKLLMALSVKRFVDALSNRQSCIMEVRKFTNSKGVSVWLPTKMKQIAGA
jgi:hypothetical protein